MRVLLTEIIDEKTQNETETRFPPLSLAYLASYLRQVEGRAEIKIISGGMTVVNVAKDFKPDVIGISTVSRNFGIAAEVAGALKSAIGAPIVIGGHHISSLPQTLSKDMDIGVIGEGEETFADIVRFFTGGGKTGADLKAIQGIVFKDNGAIVQTEPREAIKPLDKIPAPAWDLLTLRKDSVNAITSRGCPFHCVFCSSSHFWKGVRYHSPERVIQEIKTLAVSRGARYFEFVDDLFAISKDRVKEITRLLRADGELQMMNLSFSCFARAEIVDKEMVRLLKEMGIRTVALGLESGSETTLQYLKGAKASVKANEQAIELLDGAGLNVVASFVYGAPQESYSDALETVKMAARPEIMTGQSYLITPFPGTPLWEEAKARDLVGADMDWNKLNIDLDDKNGKNVIMAQKMTGSELANIGDRFKKVWKSKEPRPEDVTWAVKHNLQQTLFDRYIKLPLKTSKLKYRLWVQTQRPNRKESMRLARLSRMMTYRPVVSIITPVYNTPPEFLIAAIESVREQIYPYWELCIADDGSTKEETVAALKKYEGVDDRIKIMRRPQSGHISRATNSALELATGDFIAFLDHDDTLEPHALLEVVKTLQINPDADLIYTDEDKLNFKGVYDAPTHKSAFSPDLFLAHNYICHFTTIRRKIVEDIGGLRTGYEGSQDYDIFLRATEKCRKIIHLPQILYHWRMIPGSAASRYDQKLYAYTSGRRAIADALERRGIKGEVSYGLGFGLYSVQREVVKNGKLAIILNVPPGSLDAAKLVFPSLIKGKIPVHSFVFVSDDPIDPEDKSLFIEAEHIVNKPAIINIRKDAMTVGAAFNKAAREVDADYLVFMRLPAAPNDELHWLKHLIGHAQRDDVAAVGGKIFSPLNQIWEVGLFVRWDFCVGYPYRGNKLDDASYLSLMRVPRNCSAVSWDCMALRKQVFIELGGFEEGRFDNCLSDIDYCLKAREKGYLIVYTPLCEIRYVTQDHMIRIGSKEERAALLNKWGVKIVEDPYFNPNLKLRYFTRGKIIFKIHAKDKKRRD